MTTLPDFANSRQTVEAYNDVVRKLQERAESGRRLLLLHLANVLLKRVESLAPSVSLGGKDIEYARELKIALLTGMDADEDAVAVFCDLDTMRLDESALGKTALYFRPRSGSPRWVEVLARYGPWPSDLVPVHVPSGAARVISRSARQDEIVALSRRLEENAGEIVSALRSAGAESVEWKKGSRAAGIDVVPDLAHAVLRSEFGYGGEKSKSHWRPAIREMMGAVPDAMKRFGRYLVTGKASAFALPNDIERFSLGRLRDGAKFAEEIAPFVPKR